MGNGQTRNRFRTKVLRNREKIASMTESSSKRKVLLVVFDGFGEAPTPDPRPKGNALHLAKMINYQRLRDESPFSFLEACGEAVGLVEGGMGGSEIGHFAIGAGRVVPQTVLQINWAIHKDKGSAFYSNPALLRAFKHVENEGGNLHFYGMISDAGVHSHTNHLLALLEWVKKDIDQIRGMVYVHCIGDGRDVERQSVMRYLKMIDEKIKELELENKAHFGTIVGRFYGMDRDTNWERTKVAYDLLCKLEGDHLSKEEVEEHGVLKALETKIQDFYGSEAKDTSDYYLPPIVCDDNAAVKNGDAFIFFNFRTDRPRQITDAFELEEFKEFDRAHDPEQVCFVVFGPYSEKDTPDKPTIAFPVPEVNNNLGSWLSQKHIPQLRIAETEKYAHVTFFFNSQYNDPYDLEDRVLVPSKKCHDFSEIPEMSAREITDEVEKALADNKHDVIIVNYANADLVGHTGKLEATITAVKVLDECLGRLATSCKDNNYVFVLTGDHGNAEDMIYDDGSSKPSHSMNPVIFLVHNYKKDISLLNGGLGDVAPTILEIMGIPQPSEMTGKSLISK